MTMSNTNTSTKSTIGVVENLCLDFGTGGVYLQVQVVPHAKFGLLLRHSFHYHLVLPLRTFQMVCKPSCFGIPTQESHINCPPKLGPKAVCSASADYFVQITNKLLKWVLIDDPLRGWREPHSNNISCFAFCSFLLPLLPQICPTQFCPHFIPSFPLLSWSCLLLTYPL